MCPEPQVIRELLRLTEDVFFSKSKSILGKSTFFSDLENLLKPKLHSILKNGQETEFISEDLRQRIDKIETYEALTYVVKYIFSDVIKMLKPMNALSVEEISLDKISAYVGQVSEADKGLKIVYRGDSDEANIMLKTMRMLLECKGIQDGKEDISTCDVIVALVRMELLCKDNFIQLTSPLRCGDNDASGHEIRGIVGYGEEVQLKNPKPIVFIGLEDIVSVDFEPGPGQDVNENPLTHYLRRVLDRRIKFMDSSIWHRYVPITYLHKENGVTSDFRKDLFSTITDLVKHRGLYDTVAAQEYLEFQTRMAVNDYVCKFEGDHFRDLVPFSFHSESQFSETVTKTAYTLRENYPTITWKILLVDDYGNQGLRLTNNGTSSLTKKELIENLFSDLEKCLDVYRSPTKQWVNIEAVNSIEEARGKLKKSQYDIIILDHLLAKNNGRRRLGYELLTNVLNNEMDIEITRKKGPFGRWWIFPISGIPMAVADCLRERGISYFCDNWHISCGGDPVSAPYFFLKNLLDVMKQQLNLGIVEMKDLVDYLKIHFDPPNLISKDAKKGTEEDTFENIPQWASGLLGCFVYRFGTQEMIYNDSKSSNKDSFSSTLLQYQTNKRADFDETTNLYEHFRHLLYALAYGSSALYEDILEEIDYIEALLKRKNHLAVFEELKAGLNTLRVYAYKLGRI